MQHAQKTTQFYSNCAINISIFVFKLLTILKVIKVTSQTVIMQSFEEQNMSWIISENGFNL